MSDFENLLMGTVHIAEQENYSMFLVTCYMEGFIEIWKFKII